MIINHNLNALNAHRNIGINNTAAGKAMEKLSSGLRITELETTQQDYPFLKR